MIFRTASRFVMIVLVSLIAIADPTHGSIDCLNSDRQKDVFDLKAHKECTNDPFVVAQDDSIKQAEKLLGLSADQVTFIGCNAASFSTRMTELEQPFHFQILYSTLYARRDCISPLLHEIAHVYQLNRAGSPDKLLQSLRQSVQRVELGADFLAGLLAVRLGLNPGEFQKNLALVGSYDEESADAHGLPADRTSAFRYGYFYDPKSGSLESQYADFQKNLFGQIKNT